MLGLAGIPMLDNLGQARRIRIVIPVQYMCKHISTRDAYIPFCRFLEQRKGLHESDTTTPMNAESKCRVGNPQGECREKLPILEGAPSF